MKSRAQIRGERERLGMHFIVDRIYGAAPISDKLSVLKVERNQFGDVEIQIPVDDATYALRDAGVHGFVKGFAGAASWGGLSPLARVGQGYEPFR